MARCDDKPLVELVSLKVERFAAHVKPALDNVEVEESLLGGLDQPLLPQVQVFLRSLGHLLLLGLLGRGAPILFDLGDCSPANHEAIIVGVHDILLLKHENAVNRQGGLILYFALWQSLRPSSFELLLHVVVNATWSRCSCSRAFVTDGSILRTAKLLVVIGRTFHQLLGLLDLFTLTDRVQKVNLAILVGFEEG